MAESYLEIIENTTVGEQETSVLCYKVSLYNGLFDCSWCIFKDSDHINTYFQGCNLDKERKKWIKQPGYSYFENESNRVLKSIYLPRIQLWSAKESLKIQSFLDCNRSRIMIKICDVYTCVFEQLKEKKTGLDLRVFIS